MITLTNIMNVWWWQEANASKGGVLGAPAVQGQVLRDGPQQDTGGVHQIPHLSSGSYFSF